MHVGRMGAITHEEARQWDMPSMRPAVRRTRSMGQIYEQIAANLEQAHQRVVDTDGDQASSRMAQEIDVFQGRVHKRIQRSFKRSDFSLLRGMRGDGFNRSVQEQWDVANPSKLTASARNLYDFLQDVDARSGAILSRAAQYQVSAALSTIAHDNAIFERARSSLIAELMVVSAQAMMRTNDTRSQFGHERASALPPEEGPPPYSPPYAPPEAPPAPMASPSAPVLPARL